MREGERERTSQPRESGSIDSAVMASSEVLGDFYG